MARTKTAFVCRDCGAQHRKWQGQCAACGEWNTLAEFNATVSKQRERSGAYTGLDTQIGTLDEVSVEDLPRISCGIAEMDRVLGGGFVPGSVVLISGDPGAGKSTLLLQVCSALVSHPTAPRKVMYVTGEESLNQVAMRARRLQLDAGRILLASETRIEALTALIEQHRPDFVVVDSIQVMLVEHADSAPGSVTQVRESAAALTRIAKQRGPVIAIVGHVTKEGGLAGPKVLEHMIDTFVMLDTGADPRYRTLRVQKNRFGPINELGVFAMTERGMREIANPSAIFLSRGDSVAAGSVVTVLWEGSRALLLEVQALVDTNGSSYTRRVAVGVDSNRLALQLAVLHRHGGVDLAGADVFVNVVGGVRIEDTALDLALLLAAASSLRDRPLPPDLVVFGEVGLSGEVRPVPNGQERLREAAKHGFKRAIVPQGNAPKRSVEGLEVIGAARIDEALQILQRRD